MALPSFKEDHISQIPALQLLQQLAKVNRIEFKGETHPFSEANIHTAVQTLKEPGHVAEEQCLSCDGRVCR